jgi:hypothetical protein
MKQVEGEEIGGGTVEQKIKVSHQVLDLHVNSGPVPVTIIQNLNKLLEQPAE